MPIYEFYCRICKEVWEELMSIDERLNGPNPVCPDCGRTVGVVPEFTAPRPHSSWGPNTKKGQK